MFLSYNQGLIIIMMMMMMIEQQMSRVMLWRILHTHTEYTSNEWTTWIIWWWSIEYVKDLMAKTSKYLMANVCVRSLWFTHIQWWKTWWIWSFLSFLVWSLYTVIRSMFTIVVVVVVLSCQLVCLRFYFCSYLFGLGLTKLKKIFFFVVVAYFVPCSYY